MNKQEFLEQLRKGLSGLPQNDIDERLAFYDEMIDDRTEEGLSQEEAVTAIGSIDEIVAQTVADTPLTKIAKERMKTKREFRPWEIILIVVGSPVWLSLGIAAVAIILSLYITLWSLIVALWAVFAAFVCAALSGVAVGIFLACTDAVLKGIAIIGTGLVFAGLSVFMFYGCVAATKYTLILTKKIAIGIKNRLLKKEDA